MGFKGIRELGAEVDALTGKFKLTSEELVTLAKDADAAILKLVAARKAADEARKAAELLPGDWKSGPGKAGGVTLSEGFSAAGGYPGLPWGESLTPEQKIALGAGVTPNAFSAATADAFRALADKIDKFMGTTDNYWSQLLNKEIPYLTKGATSATDAQAMVSAILKTFIPGIMQELANPKTPIEMRKILMELMQFALSGSLQIDRLAQKVDKSHKAIVKAVEESEYHVTAGIGLSLERYATLHKG